MRRRLTARITASTANAPVRLTSPARGFIAIARRNCRATRSASVSARAEPSRRFAIADAPRLSLCSAITLLIGLSATIDTSSCVARRIVSPASARLASSSARGPPAQGNQLAHRCARSRRRTVAGPDGRQEGARPAGAPWRAHRATIGWPPGGGPAPRGPRPAARPSHPAARDAAQGLALHRLSGGAGEHGVDSLQRGDHALGRQLRRADAETEEQSSARNALLGLHTTNVALLRRPEVSNPAVSCRRAAVVSACSRGREAQARAGGRSPDARVGDCATDGVGNGAREHQREVAAQIAQGRVEQRVQPRHADHPQPRCFGGGDFDDDRAGPRVADLQPDCGAGSDWPPARVRAATRLRFGPPRRFPAPARWRLGSVPRSTRPSPGLASVTASVQASSRRADASVSPAAARARSRTPSLRNGSTQSSTQAAHSAGSAIEKLCTRLLMSCAAALASNPVQFAAGVDGVDGLIEDGSNSRRRRPLCRRGSSSCARSRTAPDRRVVSPSYRTDERGRSRRSLCSRPGAPRLPVREPEGQVAQHLRLARAQSVGPAFFETPARAAAAATPRATRRRPAWDST